MMIRATAAMKTSLSGTTTTHLTWVVVPVRLVREMTSRMRIHAVETTTREGLTARRDSGTRGSILATCSCRISICRVDTTESRGPDEVDDRRAVLAGRSNVLHPGGAGDCTAAG
jgi:hypothetical protein